MPPEPTTTGTPVTEFVDLTIDRIDGVGVPANGTPFLLLKSLAPEGSTTEPGAAVTLATDSPAASGSTDVTDTATTTDAPVSKAAACDTCKDTGKIKAGSTKCPDCDGVAKGGRMAVADLGTLLVTAPAVKADVAMLTAEAMSGDAMDAPGSPEWEAMDAAALTAMAAVLARMSKAIDCARDRELAEGAAGAEMDYSDVWDLEDAASAVDFATGILARMSFTEAVEAEGGVADDGAVVKAGKVLSAANETKIRNARDALTDVLGDGDDSSEEDNVDKAAVEKIVDDKLAAMAGGVTKAEGEEAATEAAAPEAGGAAAPEAPAAPAAASTEGAPAAAAPAAPAAGAEAPAAGTAENEPEAGGEAATAAAGTESAEEHPAEGEGVSKATEGTDVLKSMLEDVVSKAVAPLTERIASLESQPAAGGPFLATEGRTDLPQNVGDVTKALMQETDPAKRADMATTIAAATLAEAYRNGQTGQTAPVVTPG